MKKDNKTFQEMVKSILEKHDFRNECYPLDNLSQKVERTHRNVRGKIFIYKWSGLILLILVPIISTLLSVVMTEDPPVSIYKIEVMKPLSYALTFFTVINSIFKPGERFKEACNMAIQICSFKNKLITEIDTLSPFENSNLLKLCSKFSEEFEAYEKRLINLFLPEAAENRNGITSERKR